MAVLWQITELSTVDADGNYIDDLVAGTENIVGFDLSILTPDSDPEAITITDVVATLSRYREAYERTSPSVAARIVVDADLATDIIDGTSVNITIPADTMEVDRTYQLLLIATDDDGNVWPKTREYRAVA